MSTMTTFIPEEIITTLAWTLLHSLWQSAIVIFILLLFIKLFRPLSSNTRYMLYVMSLGTIVIWAVFTFSSQLINNISPVETDSTMYSWSFTPFGENTINEASKLIPTVNESYFPFFVFLWAFGVFIFSIKTLGGLWYIDRLKTTYTVLSNNDIIKKFNNVKKQLNISKNVRLFESYKVSVPSVIGHLKPAILLPIGMCTGLSIDEIEAILAHELSHIKRNDYLINILQSAVEALFFYNPIIWWLSTKINTERELSCDDVALHIGINKLTFAKALANTEQLKINTTMAMTFGKNKNNLLQRIKRTMEGDSSYRSSSGDKALTMVIVIGALISISWYSVRPTQIDNNGILDPITTLSDQPLVGQLPIIDTAMPLETINPVELEKDATLKMELKDSFSLFKEFENKTKIVLDTLPIDEPDLKKIAELQKRTMEEMKLQLHKLSELHEIKDLDLLKIKEMEKLSYDLALDAEKMAKLHEKHLNTDKLEFESLHIKMKELQKRELELHKRELELHKKIEIQGINTIEKELKEMEKIMHSKELEMQELENNMRKFESELIKELRKDGYLKKGEKLNQFDYKDDHEIKVNGKKIKEKDVKKYTELRDKYLGD